MAKHIKTGEEARKSAVEALTEIANIVGTTLGPSGRTVLTSKRNSGSMVVVSHTKDGFSVLNSLSYTDPIKDAVHKLCQQASGNSVIASGDGSTSTLVLAAAFAQALRAPGNNPQARAREFRKELYEAVEAIKAEADVSKESVKKVATTSSNNDEELASVVMSALDKASAYGTVIIEKNPMQKDRYKIDKEFGYQSSSGYNHYMPLGLSIYENLANQGEFVMKGVYVVPYNGDLVRIEQIKPYVNTLLQENKDGFKLYFIAYEVSNDLSAQIAQYNRQNPKFKIFISHATRTAEMHGQLQQLNDVAAYSGAVVTDAASAPHWTPADAGYVEMVRVGPSKTFILGSSPKNRIEERAKQNEQAAALAPSQMDREIIQSRNASLTGGCVKIVVGGGLISDLQERADRVDDAVKAAQAAMVSGALPGCGASYIRAGILANVCQELKTALRSIHDTVMENAGLEPVESFEKGETVYITDAGYEKVAHFMEKDICDSYETVKGVLINAFELGVLVANLGGYSLEADLEALEQAERTKDILGSMR